MMPDPKPDLIGVMFVPEGADVDAIAMRIAQEMRVLEASLATMHEGALEGRTDRSYDCTPEPILLHRTLIYACGCCDILLAVLMPSRTEVLVVGGSESAVQKYADHVTSQHAAWTRAMN